MEKNEQLSTLTYAVRLRVVLKYTGRLTLIQALLYLVPAGVALIFDEFSMAWRFLAVSLVLALAALPWVRYPAPKTFLHNEALAVVSLSFLIGAVAMVYPFMAAGLSFMDAVFEATSGITTTGLSTVTDAAGQSRSFLFARAWMQWCGGLGILVLTLALLGTPHIAFKRLVIPLGESENIITGMKFYARHVVSVYLVVTLCAVTLLRFSGLDGFTAAVHALCAVSTGGFSSHNDSIAGLDFFPVQIIITLTSLLGAVSFSLLYRLAGSGRGEIWRDPETRAFFGIHALIIAVLALTLTIESGHDGLSALKHAFLLGVSAQSTTGFSSLDVGNLDPGSKAVLIASMAIGGETGSTSGGIKIIRLLVLLRMIQFMIRSAGVPSHAVIDPRINGHRIESGDLTGALTLCLLFGAVVFLSWIPFLGFGYPPLDALFEIVSAIGTVGLSTGITQSELPSLLKGVLCLDMLAGRLEIIALIVLLHPRTWFGKRVDSL